VGDLTEASGSVDTPLGTVSSAWHIDGDAFLLDVEVPVGATAVVSVPVADGQDVTAPPGAEQVGMSQGRSLWRVGSGSWSFAAR
jgi:alpha-L-rhamnosidase